MPRPPSIDALTHHLAQCPPEFLAAPRVGRHGIVHVDAVVNDLVRKHGGKPSIADLDAFRPQRPEQRNWAAAVLIGCWLASHPDLVALGVGDRIYAWLRRGLHDVSGIIAAHQFVQDSDRREELARLMCASLDVVPDGETAEQARDRLSTVNSVERAAILRETQAQRKRAEELRREMAAQRAREAAAKYSRE